MTLKTTKAFEEEDANAAEIIFQSYHTLDKTVNLLVILSDFKYVYGKFSGWVSDDNGVKTKFEDIPGFIEWAKMRW